MEQSIKILTNWTIEKLVAELESGHIKIPRFQRDYIWEKTKVTALLNSIYLKYPIGTFFLWIAPNKYNEFIREVEDLNLPNTDKNGNYSFILDGQQRIISIYVSMKGMTFENTDYSNICFNLNKQIFQIPRLKKERNNIPLWKIIDENNFKQLIDTYKTKDKINKTKYVQILTDCRNIFLNYPISMVQTLHQDLDDVVEIFERINQGGKRLSAFDLVHATTWSPKFDLKGKILEFNNGTRMKNFGFLGNKVFTQALALNHFNDCSNTYQLKLTPEICSKNWNKTKNSIASSVDFFKSMQVKNDLSAYQNYIPTIQYYFYKSGEKQIADEHKKEFEKWFWDSKFSKRYTSGIFSKIKEDIFWINEMLGLNGADDE